MQGTIFIFEILLNESIAAERLVTGDPAELKNIPSILVQRASNNLKHLAFEILEKYCEWSNEYKGTNWQIENGILKINFKNRDLSISVNGDGDIVILTTLCEIRDSIFFNLADLSTDECRHPIKLRFEAFMRLYYGLIFLMKAGGKYL